MISQPKNIMFIAIKDSLKSPLQTCNSLNIENTVDMKNAFRERKKIIEEITFKAYSRLKKETEDDSKPNPLPAPILARPNIKNNCTPKINFFPLSRPNRNKLG